MPTRLVDDRGVVVCPGDYVSVLFVDRSRGAELWMDRGEVVGVGRSRVRVTFPARPGVYAVGAECLRVIGHRAL